MNLGRSFLIGWAGVRGGGGGGLDVDVLRGWRGRRWACYNAGVFVLGRRSQKKGGGVLFSDRDVDKGWSEGRKRGLAGFLEVERVRHDQHRFGCSRGNSRDVLTLAFIVRCCFADLEIACGDFAVLWGMDSCWLVWFSGIREVWMSNRRTTLSKAYVLGFSCTYLLGTFAYVNLTLHRILRSVLKTKS